MNNFFEELEMYDSEVYAACNDEFKRQQHNIELFASENINQLNEEKSIWTKIKEFFTYG